MDFATKTVLITFLIILAIIFIPLLIGVGIAILMGMTGFEYFGTVFLSAVIIWAAFAILFLYWLD